jgi:hypothetical protein
MILTNLNRWDIVLYLRSWKERKCHTHAEPCRARRVRVTRIFMWKNRMTYDEWRVRVREEILISLLLYRVNVLPFLRIESTQLKRCIKYIRY